MQSVSSRVGTHVAMSISYDDNRYTTDTASPTWVYVSHAQGQQVGCEYTICWYDQI